MLERFPARRSRGGEAAAPVAGLLLFLALAALVFGASREPSPTMLAVWVLAAVVAAAGGFLAVWAIGYQRLGYALTDSALRIDWLGRTLVVPYPAVQGIYTGQRLEGQSTPDVPRWPGINVGPRRTKALGRLRFFATSTDQSKLTLITVEHGGLIISAQNPTEFRAALIERVEQHSEGVALEQRVWQQRAPSAAPWTAFADAWLPACAALGVVCVLVLLAVIDLRYAAVPDQLPVRFDQVEPKSSLLRLPLFGLICLAVNWVAGVWLHARDRLLARLLWLGGIVVQLILLIAVIRIVA